MRNTMLLMFFGAIFFISGCEGDRKEVVTKSENSPVEMNVEGHVYVADPSASIYEDVYGDSSIDVVISDVEKGDPYATFLFGYLYFANFPSYGVDQNYVKAREFLERAWGMGVVDAGYSLYKIYSRGLGVGEDVELGIRYLEESSEKGLVVSQINLAEDYFGRGDVDLLPTDYAQAIKWYTAAAEKGDRRAAIALATIYNEGLGVDIDDEKTFEWVSRSEEMKYGPLSLSTNALAWCYEEGIGTEVDLVQAYKYRDLMGTAGRSYKGELAETMTPEQIEQAVRLSGEWQREHNISMPNSEGYRYR